MCFRRWYQFPHLRYSGSEELFRTVKKELAVFQLYQIRRTDKSCCHLFPACIPYTMTYYYSTPNKYQFQILSEKNYTIKTYFFSRLKGVNIVTNFVIAKPYKANSLQILLYKKCGGDNGARTRDLLTASQTLSQLSYTPI